MITDPEILSGHKCPYCGEPTEYIDDKEIYGGTGYRMAYICRPCGAWVGCHPAPRQTESMGRLANKELRSWKKAAKTLFNALWQNHKTLKGNKARQAAYKWLAKEMNLEAEYCHVGFFGLDECKQLYYLCKKYIK